MIAISLLIYLVFLRNGQYHHIPSSFNMWWGQGTGFDGFLFYANDFNQSNALKNLNGFVYECCIEI